MNAMVGDAGDISVGGTNQNNPHYVQFFRITDIQHPTRIFVFLDEHPDSINDGYFINRAYTWKWIDLPATYHGGATTFAFADGHSEMHRWLSGSTAAPSQPEAAALPRIVPQYDQDFDWLTDKMSVHPVSSTESGSE